MPKQQKLSNSKRFYKALATLILLFTLALTGGQMLEFFGGLMLGFMLGFVAYERWQRDEDVEDDEDDWNYK